MSDQADKANAFARKMLGQKMVDAAAAASNFNVLQGGSHSGGGEVGKAKLTWVKLPTLSWTLSQMAQQVGQVMATEEMFTREGVPVLVDSKTGQMNGVTAQKLRSELERWLIFWKGKSAQDAEGEPTTAKVPVTMTVDVARGLLECSEFVTHLRPIARVNVERMPIVRKDGSLVLLKPGYDEEAKIYTMSTALDIDEKMEKPRAMAIWNDLVGEIPFGDYNPDTEEFRKADTVGLSRSKAVQFSCAISLYGSGLLSDLSNRLHYVFGANAQRSGKTLCAKMCVSPIFGPAKIKTLPKDDNELRKMLDSSAIGNAPYFFLDDLEGSLRSTELNAFMTAPTWSNRKFNQQMDFSAPKQTVVIITGNNLGLSTDLANRTLLCMLYTEEFDAQKREIKRVIDEEYLTRPNVRRDILSALWCFIREWDMAGRPLGKRVLKGFEAWCNIFGGITINAGFGDPVAAPPTDDFTGDNEGTDMMTMVQVLVDHMGKKPMLMRKMEYTFDDLVSVSIENNCFEWMIDGVEKVDKETDEKTMKLTPRSKSALGKMFSAKYGGRKFTLADGRAVRFGHRGRNRHRRYQIEILSA